MSDGPFTSPLPKPCWNPVLERAANESFTIEQVSDAVPTALAAECGELPKGFLEQLRELLKDDAQNSFLQARESGELDALHEATNGDALALLIVRWIDDALETGCEQRDAVVDALCKALGQCWGDRARMMEEHAQRDLPDRAIAQWVRGRLKDATPSPGDLRDIARAILKLEGKSIPRSPRKSTGIEQGPSLKLEDADET